jgi:hypothetical protein
MKFQVIFENYLPENCLVLVVDNQLFPQPQNHANQSVNMQLKKATKSLFFIIN